MILTPRHLAPFKNKRLVVSLVGLISPATVLGQSTLDDASYFFKSAETGFAYHVQGLISPGSTDPHTGLPNLIQDSLYNPISDPKLSGPGPRNSYPWSMAWFNGQLYVGTNRNLHCSNAYTGRNPDPDCPVLDEGSVVPLPDDLWRAEIWRYTPSALTDPGKWGLAGTWQRLYRSPNINTIFTTRLSTLLSVLSILGVDTAGATPLPTATPRDGGYRALKACDAGGTTRLYAATYGIPGNILVMNAAGTDFSEVPSTGTYNDLTCSLANFSSWTNCQRIFSWGTDQTIFDLGYRGLDCFKGNLWTSPAGTVSDPDIPYHPVLFRNANPSSTTSSWSEVVDVSDWDINNVGIFQIEHVGDYLFLSVINRVTGFQLWRGAVTTPTCTANTCVTWEKIIDQGAGRPLVDGTIENAGATLGVFEYAPGKFDLYMGVGESGYSEEGLTSAELLRIRDAHLGNKNWELLVGWPRKDYATIPNMTCPMPVDIPATTVPHPVIGTTLITLPSYLADADDEALDDCLPTSGYGPGMAVPPNIRNVWINPNTDTPPFPWNAGRENYFWRFATHDQTLFMGTLGRSSLWRFDYPVGLDSQPDATQPQITRVFTGGLGDPANLGIRTITSMGDFGLALGFTNTDFAGIDEQGKRTGGLEIHLGADLVGEDAVPPVAVAEVVTNVATDENETDNIQDNNGDGILDIFDINRDSRVVVNLSGINSFTWFGGSPITDYEWFHSPGTTPVDCATAMAPNGTGAGPVAIEVDTGTESSLHTLTLRVTSLAGRTCDSVTINASHNLPPAMPMVFPSIPFAGNRVNLIDFDGDTFEAYDVEGTCEDLDPGDHITLCQWVPEDGATTLSNLQECTLPASGCDTTATLRVLRTDLANAQYDDSSPNMRLVAKDKQGYTTNYNFSSQVFSAVPDTNPSTNTAPVCRNVAMEMEGGTALIVDPTSAVSGDGRPICLDRDGNPLTYQIRDPIPNNGTCAVIDSATRLQYTPTASFSGLDKAYFRATDGQPSQSTSQNFVIEINVKPHLADSCQKGDVTLGPTVFGPYSFSRASEVSITTQGTVGIQSGADVTLKAPRIILKPGFKVDSGAIVNLQSVVVTCPEV